ncbi:MAG: energy transducer TonB [Bacteroidales bacterium]|nr:energy transducer TonB [Bacteroidales bacterium]
MKKFIFAILMACISFASFAQDKNAAMEVKSTVASGFDKCAMYPGGENGMNTFLHKNIDYPMAAIKSGKEGNVTVQFTVNTDGTVSNVKVVKGLEPSLDAEAIKVVSKMKGWTPAMKGGKAVPMDYQVNCNFTK